MEEEAAGIGERKKAHEALGYTREERAHSTHLLSALSLAAQELQWAHTPADVYRSIGEQVVRMGYHATILSLGEEGTHLIVSQMTLSSGVVRAAEELSGLTARSYRFPVEPEGTYRRILTGRKTVLVSTQCLMAEAVPPAVRPLAGQLTALLGIPQSIVALLVVNGEAEGCLVVSGQDLTESDVSAVTAFASQAAVAVRNARLLEDVSRREREWKATFDAMSDWVTLVDRQRRIRRSNRASLEFVGLPPTETMGRICCDLLRVNGSLLSCPLPSCPLPRMFDSRRRESIEVPLSGGQRWLSITVDPVLGDGGDLSGAVHIVRDITARKAAEARIQAQLREKEVLLKEVHHRVKNNLQFISSLLSLQAGSGPGPEAVALLEASQDRIQSIALIHEHLYTAENLADVDLSLYIRDLVEALVTSHWFAPETPRLSIDAEEIPVSLDSAVHLGLILTELVSNSLKHAFPGGVASEIRISARADAGGCLILAVADDGAGLPPGLDFRHTASLGLQIVCDLVDQLGGEIVLEGGAGTAFTVTLPGSPPSPAGQRSTS